IPPPSSAAGLSRYRLDEALLAAAERAGAVVMRGTRVLRLEPQSDAILIRTEKRVWRASAVALATGKHLLRGIPRRRGEMVGFKLHLDSPVALQELADLVQLVFFRGGYMGACLVEHDTLSIAWVMREELVRSVGSSWSAQEHYLARQSDLIGDLLCRAR